MNGIDWGILLLLGLWLVAASYHVIKTKKAGGCVGCSEADHCMRRQQERKKSPGGCNKK